MARMRLNCKAWYLIFRTASFLAAALPPAIRAMQLFTVWREETVIKVQAGLGAGAVMALVLILWAFRDTVIGTMKKHMGLVVILEMSLRCLGVLSPLQMVIHPTMDRPKLRSI